MRSTYNMWQLLSVALAMVAAAMPAAADPQPEPFRAEIVAGATEHSLSDKLSTAITNAKTEYEAGKYAESLAILQAQLPHVPAHDELTKWQILSDMKLCHQKLHQDKQAEDLEPQINAVNKRFRLVPLTDFTEIPNNARVRAAVAEKLIECAAQRKKRQQVLTKVRGGWMCKYVSVPKKK